MRKKWVKVVVCVLLILVVLAVIVPLPINIYTHAVEIIFSDDSHFETRTVRIRGWFNFNVFTRWHGFRGTIEILEHPETSNNFAGVSLRFHPAPFDGSVWGVRSALFEYVGGLEPERIPSTSVAVYPRTTFGVMYATPFFRQAMIILADDDMMSLRESRVVVLNATTREEALEMWMRTQ